MTEDQELEKTESKAPEDSVKEDSVEESDPGADSAVEQDFEQNAFTQLAPDLQRAIVDQGYETPTPIQQQIIPALQEGRDAIGIAQTGTGKTAAFTLPLLHRLVGAQRPDPRRPRALILAPTRELAQQISDSIRTYGRYLRASHMVIYGGVSQYPQVKALRRGVDIVVATPGRLLDLVRQGHIHLNSTGIFILDEVDRMLDMGFIEDINQIVDAMSDDRQTMFFSATMPPKIEELARSLVTDPVRVEITPDQLDLDRISQKVRFVHRKDKMPLLLDMLHDRGDGEPMQKVIIFSQTKVMANKLAEQLNGEGFRTTAIHGDKTQRARAQALQGFKTNRFRVLVATDVAARGLDVDDISHVINYDLPIEAETYVHRIGRTGRAGRTGDAISFCSPGDQWNLRAVDKLMGEPVARDFDHPYHNEKAYQSVERKSSRSPRNSSDRTPRKPRKPGQFRDDYRGRSDRRDWKNSRDSKDSRDSRDFRNTRESFRKEGRDKDFAAKNRSDRKASKPWEREDSSNRRFGNDRPSKREGWSDRARSGNWKSGSQKQDRKESGRPDSFERKGSGKDNFDRTDRRKRAEKEGKFRPQKPGFKDSGNRRDRDRSGAEGQGKPERSGRDYRDSRSDYKSAGKKPWDKGRDRRNKDDRFNFDRAHDKRGPDDRAEGKSWKKKPDWEDGSQRRPDKRRTEPQAGERISRKTRRLKDSRSQSRQGSPVASPAWNTGSKKKRKDAKKKKERKLKREKTVLAPAAKSKKGKNTRRADKRRKPWDNMHK